MIKAWNTDTGEELGDSPSYKVEVLVQGEREFVPNGLRFCTIDGAVEYACDLTSRWFAVTAWRVAPSEDVPNRD